MKKGLLAVLAAAVGSIVSAGVVLNYMNKRLKYEKELDVKNDTILKVFAQWMRMEQDGRRISDYLKENNYKTIAIYGMHYLGECLYAELEHSEIEIKYVIDKNASNIDMNVRVVTPDETLEKVDAVIVTPIYYFDQIADMLSEKISCPIVSLEDIVYELEL